jgi:hypothetical protein
MASCKELSEDREAVSRLAKHFWDIEKSATPVSILLPWFPSSAKKVKQKATVALYGMLLSYVHLRRKCSTPSVDPIDFFISQGTSDGAIMEASFRCDCLRYIVLMFRNFNRPSWVSSLLEWLTLASMVSVLFYIISYKAHEILVRL